MAQKKSNLNREIKSYSQLLEEYPEKYLDCRVDRHSWVRAKTPIDPFFLVPYGWPVYRVCVKCGAFWTRAYNRSLTEKWYERRYYPPDYLLKGVGHTTKQRTLAFVREMIEREGTEYLDGDS